MNIKTMALVMGTMAFAACGNDDPTPYNGGDDDAQPALVSVEQIIDGCMDIANEVGNAKIGDPLDLWNNGEQTKALYAVESWYSWHSREDYSNNILSIRNAFYGTRNGQIAANSLATLLKGNNAELFQTVDDAIQKAHQTILNIPAPFRNNINALQVTIAVEACNELEETLKSLKAYLQRNEAVNSDEVLQPILVTYVNDVVLPTYKELMEKNTALYETAKTFATAPSDENFQKCCNAWLEARTPWETSEAFLFGPVDALGLDPNMDSWPLDQEAIVNILNSGEFDNMIWGDGDDDETVEAKQGVRGFHTMEFLIFKDGQTRTINGGTSTDAANLDYTTANAQSWGNYMVQVGKLLQQDATELYNAWTKSYEGGKAYKDLFLSHDIESDEEE
ncbi:MAG: peptidase M75 [Bacteroidaceae bacterium]|nr:peptidase M75 [Bacteroidaceae bacterium]